MYDNLSIEEVVDELKRVRDLQKDLKTKEDSLKDKIIADGRNEIKGNEYTMKISFRDKETFNEEAFLEKFKEDNSFDKDLKNEIIKSKLIIDQANLSKACQDGKISLDYVLPFNEVVTSKVISVK